jgi:Flp pilus assembly pilin Flp
MDGAAERRCARSAGSPARSLVRRGGENGQAAVEWAGLLVLVAAIVAAITTLHLPSVLSGAIRCEAQQITQGSGCALGVNHVSTAALGPANPSSPGGGIGESQAERILGSNRLIFACAGNGRSEVGASLAPESAACKAQLAKLSPRAISMLELMAALFQTAHDWRPGGESKQQYFQTLLGYYMQDPGGAVIALSRAAQALQAGPILTNEKIESTPGDLWDGFLGSLCGGYGVCLGGTVLSQAYQQSFHTSAGIASITTPVLYATGVAAALKDLAATGVKAVVAKFAARNGEQMEQTVEELEAQAEKGGGGGGGGGSPPPGGGSPPPPGGGPGDWAAKNESMSERARAYQDQITGQPNAAGSYVYKASGGGETADFDGYRDGKLIEAKGPGYAGFTKNGQFQRWWVNSRSGGQQMLAQARREATVAKSLGVPLEWDVAEPQAAEAIQTLLEDNGITGITVRYVPPQP